MNLNLAGSAQPPFMAVMNKIPVMLTLRPFMHRQLMYLIRQSKGCGDLAVTNQVTFIPAGAIPRWRKQKKKSARWKHMAGVRPTDHSPTSKPYFMHPAWQPSAH